MTAELDRVRALLTADEILALDTAEYLEESKTWAAQKNLRPKLVVQPKSLESLCKLVALLRGTTLDIGVRSQGYGSSSAKDVLISMTRFDAFEYNLAEETITIGAGQTWNQVDENIDKFCPGYATLSTRSGFLGVAGSIVYGGLSWASSERGAASRPENLLDAQVVKADGTAVWASTDPDLFWCIRGGGHSFGIVTAVKVRIFKFPKSVFTGRLVYPSTSLQHIAREVAAFTRRVSDPKLCLHLYWMTEEEYSAEELPDHMKIGSHNDSWSRGMKSTHISIWIYDAHGEQHARSKDGFAWAFGIPGATDKTMNLTFTEVNRLANELMAAKGATDSWMSAPLISDISEDLILRAWEWFEETVAANPVVKNVPLGVMVLIEMLQKPAIHTKTPRTDCAWPHTRAQHVLQLGVAAPIGDVETGKRVLQALEEAPKRMCPEHQPGDFLPNFIQKFNDISAIYGPNYKKLQVMKQKYDPKGIFGGPFM
ncbi:fad binding domain-containing [Trichoderma arundinaceum]|uniref:Fad binding domain-containing n=1 Tax=Trichoderma arundinaceum TaxID=490622 RepID=A0A395NJX8_TRIAR|nr:fad binding domain-containing [Trichoderma arundinaceum]